jgi:hypothetical protein
LDILEKKEVLPIPGGKIISGQIAAINFCEEGLGSGTGGNQLSLLF